MKRRESGRSNRGIHRACFCSRSIGRAFGIVAIATLLFASSSARADSAIDAGVQPYFVIGGLVTALVFLGLGFFMLRKAIRNRRMAAAAAQWPTTDGTVISTDVVKRTHKSENGGFDYFVPQIRYEYKANGSRRQGNVIRIGLDDMGYMEENKAREHVARYPVGATIPVRYDPDHPDDAVLEIGEVGVTRKIFAGAILAALGVAAIVFAIWSATLPPA